MRILLPYQFVRVRYFGCGCGECASFDYFDGTIAPMMIVIAVVMNAMSKFELRAVRTGSDACCSLLIAITDAALLDENEKERTRHEQHCFVSMQLVFNSQMLLMSPCWPSDTGI